jgi:hypothetical protein
MRPISVRFLTLIFACVLLAMLGQACATMQEKSEARPAANLVITPNSGPPKSIFQILGSGFTPGEKIEIIMVVDGIPTELGEEPMIKEANEMGAFKAKSGIPGMAKPGVYTVKATGDKGTVAVAPLNVEEKPKKK